MGIPDPEGKKYHRDDWKSNDGVRKDATQHWVTVWVHTTKALLKNIILAMDPLVAWKKIEHCEHTVNFLGGKRAKPRGDHGVISFAMGRSAEAQCGRRLLGTEVPDSTPGSIAGCGTCGKQQSMEIANVLQDEVIRRLGMVETDVGVFYHAWLASAKAKHVYVIHARSQMIQENVAAALAGDVIPVVEREVYYAASEMQLLEDSIRKFKAELKTLTGADSNSTARRKKSRAVLVGPCGKKRKRPLRKRWIQNC
jgi:hypothetical protein